MIIEPEQLKEIEKKFKSVYTYKDEAKEANATATLILNEIAEQLDPNATKEKRKKDKKAIKKAYREWVDHNMGDTSGDTASVITTQLILSKAEEFANE